MPSFDVVSEVDLHELANAVDQANREVSTRFDFKGSGASFEVADGQITLKAEGDFQLQQMLDILRMKLAKRNVDIAALDPQQPQLTGREARQVVVVRQGIDSDLGRRLVKMIKEQKLKVQVAIQGDQVRVTGKKRDDLQQVIALLRASDIELPMQFVNFRD